MSNLRKNLRVTHPFHPLFNKEFEIIGFFNSWKKECIEFLDDQGNRSSLPLEWTDAADIDPFLHFSIGRSHFRIDELLRLVDLVDAIAGDNAPEPPEHV